MNESVDLARKVFGIKDSIPIGVDHAGFRPVEIDITRMSNDLYDQLLREFHKQHGYGIYIRWQITAIKGDTNER